MIAIINDHTLPGEDPITGRCEYRLMINNREICRFTHKRSDGLALCLNRAASAARDERDRVALECVLATAKQL